MTNVFLTTEQRKNGGAVIAWIDGRPANEIAVKTWNDARKQLEIGRLHFMKCGCIVTVDNSLGFVAGK